MCGRYSLISPGELVAEVFGLESAPELEPRYNVAPTQEAAVVRRQSPRDARALERPEDAGRRRLDLLRWGLIPHWANDPGIGNRMINARSESVADKPSFRDSFRSRRCLVVADGYYEWRAEEDGKQPYRFRRPDGRPLAFAGLWDRWWQTPPQPVDSFTILTAAAAPTVAPYHHRMPVLLPPESWETWLDPAVGDPAALQPLLGAAPPELTVDRVGRAVNDPGNDGPECIRPLSG